MKRILFILLCAIQMLTALAYDVKYNNVYYNLDNEHMTASVTYAQKAKDTLRTDYKGKVIIDEKIEVEGMTYVVNAIGENAFLDCLKLNKIEMPNTIRSIGNSAFENCFLLETIMLSNTLKHIGSRAFYGCEALSTIILPNQMTTIGPEAFCNCYSLTNIFIPNTVTDIGYDAFYDCINLYNLFIADAGAWCNINFSTIYSNPLYYANNLMLKGKPVRDLIIPQTVTDIKPYAFVGCKTLVSLTISNTICHIGEMAFYNCANLLNVIISASVETIEYNAFKFCSNIGALYLYNPETKVDEGAFNFCAGTLHVVKNYKEQYAKSQQWEDFMIIDDVPPFCAPPTITYSNGKLQIRSHTPGATCHLLQTIGEVAQGEKISDLPVSAYATAEGYQPSKVVTVWLKELIENE